MLFITTGYEAFSFIAPIYQVKTEFSCLTFARLNIKLGHFIIKNLVYYFALAISEICDEFKAIFISKVIFNQVRAKSDYKVNYWSECT